MFSLRNKKDYQIKEPTKNLGLCPIDNQVYSFKYAFLKCRLLNDINKTNYIVDDDLSAASATRGLPISYRNKLN